MVVMTDYTVLTLTVWGEQLNHCKLIRNLRQVMIGNALHPDIYDDYTIRGITWLMIGYGRHYFRHSLMQSIFTRNSTCIPNINIRLVGKPTEHGNANQSQRYIVKVGIQRHRISNTGKQKKRIKRICLGCQAQGNRKRDT